MCPSSRKPAQLKPHQVALTQLQKHYLLGPVASKVQFYAASRLLRFDLPPAAYCQIEGRQAIDHAQR